MAVKTTQLIEPYGGTLVDLLVPSEKFQEKLAYAKNLPSIRLSNRAQCDLELLAVGAFSPLDSFMSQADLQSVMDDMRLANGAVFPMPITLDVDEEDPVEVGGEIALRDRGNNVLAIMKVEEKYEWNIEELSEKVFGKYDLRHPLVAEMHRWGKYFISGPMEVIELPPHYDFGELRMTPAQVREKLAEMGHENVVAFQTRNPMHRVHEELTKRAASGINGALLLHPVVGMTKPGDVDHYTRVRTYKALKANYYEPDRICLSLLPLAMRMAGPREALWHAIIRRNYGANHIIVGRDHAGPGKDSEGNPFYGPYDAQDLVIQYEKEIGMTMVPFKMLVYLPDEERYEEIDKVTKEMNTASISGTQVRNDYLAQGRPLPSWFSRPEVAGILVDTYRPRAKQGVCIWLTGLSGSGKSTSAEILASKLREHGRQVTVLDGDVVRTHFSQDLGFSKEDRDQNIRNMGFVASTIVHHGGVVICAAVSPYRVTRNDIRATIKEGHFIEVFLDCPLEVVEARDEKGLYAKARRGEIKGFTGIDDPYEKPLNPELTIDTAHNDAVINANIVFSHLLEQGFVEEIVDEPAVNGKVA